MPSPREPIGEFLDREDTYRHTLTQIRALPESRGRVPGIDWWRFLDSATYWATITSLYVAYGFLWGYGAQAKLVDENGHMPASLAKLFDGTVIAGFPGLSAAWLALGLLEAVVFVAFLASAFAGEFLPHRGKPIFIGALAGSMVVFAVVTVGEGLVSNYGGVGSLFAYMGATGLVYALLRFVPTFNGTAREWRG